MLPFNAVFLRSIVAERSFADALGIHPGDRLILNGQPFRVAGVAVTAAVPASGLGFLEGDAGVIQAPRPGVLRVSQQCPRFRG